MLSRDTILADLEARDRRGALRELAGAAARAGVAGEEGELVRLLEERERRESTAVGGGVAIPHARLRGIPAPRLAVARSAAGIDFGAPDGLPVRLLFLLLSPEGEPDLYLGALARLSRLVREPALRDALLSARGRDEMHEILVREDQRS